MLSKELAISVRDLSKSYTIAHDAVKHSTASEALIHSVKNLRKRSTKETFWALRDVSFDIKKGDVVGIIGRNGAGKSTLLKILSQITEPTKGEIRLYGRVGSLLEVGTGFHPELTGRENIFLNGAILGMNKSEIARQFDAIVDFAEVEKFLDTPVKRYSSGMYVRLAFAVAAHLNPEILIVDEVLAVGDANFQKKCLGKMEEIGDSGRTVIFVSHNMSTVLRLCKTVILMNRGQVLKMGTGKEITSDYLALGNEKAIAAERVWATPEQAPGDTIARLRAARVLNARGEVSETIDIAQPMFIEIEYEFLGGNVDCVAAFHVVNEMGVTLFASGDFANPRWKATPRTPGVVRSTCQIPAHFFAEGRMAVLVAVCSYNPDVVHALESDALAFVVVDQTEGTGVRGHAVSTWPGVVRPMLQWDVTSVQ